MRSGSRPRTTSLRVKVNLYSFQNVGLSGSGLNSSELLPVRRLFVIQGAQKANKQVWSRQTSDASPPPSSSPSRRNPLHPRSRNHAFSRIQNKSVTDAPTEGRMDGRTLIDLRGCISKVEMT